MKVLFLFGPNLGALGTRDPERYGRQTLAEIMGDVASRGTALGHEVEWRQSDHAGDLGAGLLRQDRRLRDEVPGAGRPDQHRRLMIEVDRHLFAHAPPEAAEEQDEGDRRGNRCKRHDDLRRLGQELPASDRNGAAHHGRSASGAGPRRGRKRGVRAA